jgi:predicted extracellular nuclease
MEEGQMVGVASSMRRAIRIAVIGVMLCGLSFTSFRASFVQAVSPDVVISQVYGGGGNGGATYTNDFIELYNLGVAPVDLTGWSVQYASATGAAWQVTALTGSIASGSHYLIQESAGAGGTTPLPTPDLTGSIAMSGTAGKVALVTSATALTCGSSCASAANVRDFIGYGTTANNFEGSGPAPAPSNTTADLRASGGADTDNNAADFTTGAPNPRNSGSSGPPPPVTVRIHGIQGAAHLSPLNHQSVSNVPGIVTGRKSNGFYLQDPNPDNNIATSEGIFVFGTAAASSVAVGDSVTVNGTVNEFRPGSTGLTVTEIGSPTVTVVSSGNTLPAPVVIGTGGRIAPSPTIEDDATGDVETSGVFDPENDAIDFYESLEGMRVRINDAIAVGPTNSFGETPVLPDNGGGATNRTARGGVYVSDYTNFNPRRVIIDSTIVTTPHMNVGDSLTGATTGVLNYDFGDFMVDVTDAPVLTPGGLAKETTDPQSASQLAIATFNVENLDPSDGPAKFNGLAAVIVNNLRSPDLVALEEIQDNNGPTDDGTVDATTTASTLISAITAAGGPAYQYRDIVPVNDQDGGEPGGNIRVGFLFRTDRGLAFVNRPGGTPTNAVSVVTDASGAHLSFSPGRIQPTDPAFAASRKPLAGEFTFHGQRVFVIANHFDAKLGDTPLFGHIQPPTRSSEVQRAQQATIVHDFVQDLLTADPQAKTVVLGDLNDFQFSPALATLKGTPPILTDLITTLPANEQYTYDFEGNSEVLDHILVTSSLNQAPLQYDVVHVNSEFTDQVSDHEPQVVRLTLTFPAPTIASVNPARGATTGGTSVTITGTGFQPDAAVTFGGTAATNVTASPDGTQITATTAPHAAGRVDLVVTNPDGQHVTLTDGFEYFVPAPVIAAISPNTGKVGAGTTVTITGTGFQTGATVLFGNQTARSIQVVNATTITAEAPPQPPGVVDVTVINPDGQNGTLPGGYTYVTGSGKVPPGRSAPTGDTGTSETPAPAPASRP